MTSTMFTSPKHSRLVRSCHGAGAQAHRVGSMLAERLAPTAPDGTADVMDPRTAWPTLAHRVCLASVRPAAESGHHQCWTDVHVASGRAHDYPRPLAVLRYATAVVRAVLDLSPDLSVVDVRCSEEWIGQSAEITVRHARGGKGAIRILLAHRQVWVDRCSCPIAIMRTAESAIAEYLKNNARHFAIWPHD